MKLAYVPIFVLIIFPALAMASTTDELGADIPESQLLTNADIAAYQEHLINHPFPDTHNHTQNVTPNGLHIYVPYHNHLMPDITVVELAVINEALKASQQNMFQSKVHRSPLRLELYLEPATIRSILLENKLKSAKKSWCWIL